MNEIIRIGMDTSKRIFQLHGVDASERVVLRKKLTRDQMIRYFEQLPPTVVVLEACGSAHHWARELTRQGHAAKLIAPQLAKPFVKRGKNDAADAEGLLEASSRPSMRYVPAKTVDQQAALMLAGERARLVRESTRLANTVRGYAAEFGLIGGKGTAQIEPLLVRLRRDRAVPEMARSLFADLAADYARIGVRIAAVEARLTDWHKSNETARRLTAIPGVGRIGASLLVMKTPDPGAFRCGRDYAAWLGLTPKDHSTAGKLRLGGITRAGDETLRSLLVVGATAVIQQARRGRTARPMPWLMRLLARKPAKLAAVALANKIARVAWRLMASGGTYNAAIHNAAIHNAAIHNAAMARPAPAAG